MNHPKASSLRAARMDTMSRFAGSQPLRLREGGDLQIPTGAGMDRAGFLARNPNVQQGGAGTPAPLAPQPTAPAITPPSVSPMPAAAQPRRNEFGQDMTLTDSYKRQSAALAPAPAPAAAPVAAPQSFPMQRKGRGFTMTALPGAAPAAAPAAPEPEQPMTISNSSVLQGFAQEQNRAANPYGLRDGGDLRTGQGGAVPGTGQGDKVPAKYEPGEFVVSNDMLDAQPELRQHLRGLREAVLADKGMTPEQADAKAMNGGTLRAATGAWKPKNPNFAPNDPISAEGQGVFDDIMKQAEEQKARAAAAEGAAAKEALNKANPAGATATAVEAPKPGRLAPLRAGLGNVYSAVKSVGPAVLAGGGGYVVARAAQDIGKPDEGNTPAYKPQFQNAEGIPSGHDHTLANTNGPHNFFNDTDLGRNLRTNAGALAAIPGLGLGTQAAGRAVRAVETVGAATAAGAMAGMGPASGQPRAQSATPAPKLTIAGDATMPGQAPGRAAALASEAVTTDDRLRSDALVKEAFSRDAKTGGTFSMDDGINTLRSSPSDMAKANEAWAMRGAGIKAAYDSKGGLVLSNSTGPEKMAYTRPDGTPTRSYEETDQYADGQRQLAAARQSMTNPDGSQWSAGDSATMAANLRDGIDPYRGTSRAPKADSVDSQLQAAMTEYADPNRQRAPGRGKALRTQIETLRGLSQDASTAKTSRENNANTNNTALRGQDMEYEGRVATAQSAATKARQDQANKDREHRLTQETHDQTVGAKNRENAMKEFRVADPKDPTKWDEVASQQSYDAVRQIFPKIDSASEKDRSEAMPDAKAMAKIFNKARTQDAVGWDAMKFWEAKRPMLNGMPNVAGTNASSVEQVGLLDGMVMINGSRGETILTQKDGRKLNLGILDSRERALLEKAQSKGWGN